MHYRFHYLALAVFACTVHATTIWDQSPPNDNATNIVDFRLADDFVLTGQSTVDMISFWYQAQFQADLASVTFAIYSDSGDALGTLLDTGTVTPVTSVDVNAFFATFTIPDLSLAPGTYWLELHSGSSLTDNTGFAVDWAASADNMTFAALLASTPNQPNSSIGTSGFEQYAFQLGGTEAPEPSPIILCSTGILACIAFLIRRKKHEYSQHTKEHTHEVI